MWASNCEYLLDYLEQKQSRLPPHDFSLEYAYKTVRLQVERGDAREHERVKALRIMFVELGDGEFADCPIDLRQWLRSTQMEQKERLDREREHEKQHLQQQQQHQLLLQRKKQKHKERAAHHAPAHVGRAEQQQEEEASPAGVRSEAGTKLIGEHVEQKLDGSLAMAAAVVGAAGGSSVASSASPADNMLLESPMHSEGTSDTDEMMNASDLFAISADSITLASQLASAKKLSAAQRRRTNKGGKGRGAAQSSSAAISAWADPSDSALHAVAAAGALTGADALERPPSRKAHERKRISGRRHRHHRHRRGGSGTVAVPHAASTTSATVSPSPLVDGPPSANPSRTESGGEFKRRDSGAFLLRTGGSSSNGGGSAHHRSGENKLSDTATANSSSSLGVEFLPSQARVRGRAESKSAAHIRQVRRGSYKLLHPLGVEDAFVGATGTGVGVGVGVGAAVGAGGGGGGDDDGDGGGEAYVKRRPSQIQIPSSPTPVRPRKMTIDANNRQAGGGRRKLTIDGSRRRASIERRGSLGLLTRRLSNESVGSSPDAASTAHASPSVLMRHAVGGGGADGGGSGSGSGGDSAGNHGAPGRLARPAAAARSGRRRSSSAPGMSSGSPRIVWQADPVATSGGGGGSVGGDAMSATPEGSSSSSSSSSSASTSRFAPSPRVRKASISGAHRMPKTHHRRRRESSAERALQVVESALYANATQKHHHPRRRPSFGAAPPALEAKSAVGAVRFRGK